MIEANRSIVADYLHVLLLYNYLHVLTTINRHCAEGQRTGKLLQFTYERKTEIKALNVKR